MTQLQVIFWIVAASCMMGCYSVSSFQSPSAAMRDYGSFTDYQYIVMFDRFEMQQSTKAEYDFRGAPSREFIAVIVMDRKEDLDLLIAHSATAHIVITRDSGEVVYDFVGPLSSDFSDNEPLGSSSRGRWNFRTYGGFNGPPDWNWNKTRVSIGSSSTAFRLDRCGYHVELRMNADASLPRRIGVTLSLQGFGRGSI